MQRKVDQLADSVTTEEVQEAIRDAATAARQLAGVLGSSAIQAEAEANRLAAIRAATTATEIEARDLEEQVNLEARGALISDIEALPRFPLPSDVSEDSTGSKVIGYTNYLFTSGPLCETLQTARCIEQVVRWINTQAYYVIGENFIEQAANSSDAIVEVLLLNALYAGEGVKDSIKRSTGPDGIERLGRSATEIPMFIAVTTRKSELDRSEAAILGSMSDDPRSNMAYGSSGESTGYFPRHLYPFAEMEQAGLLTRSKISDPDKKIKAPRPDPRGPIRFINGNVIAGTGELTKEFLTQFGVSERMTYLKELFSAES